LKAIPCESDTCPDMIPNEMFRRMVYVVISAKRFWTKWRVVAVTLAMVATGPSSYLFYHYEREVKKWGETQARFIYYRVSSGLNHDLAVGNIKPGDSVESVLEKYSHLEAEEYGRLTIIRSNRGHPLRMTFSDTTLEAIDGKLISAASWSCTYDDTFFQIPLSDRDQYDYTQALAKREHRLNCFVRDLVTLRVALAGVAANTQVNSDGTFYFPDLNNPPRE
jgi:hypothetical protein